MLDQTSTTGSSASGLQADLPGLIFAYRFRNGQAEPLSAGSVTGALGEPGGWIWVHLDLAEPHARDWVAQHAPLPERARAILLSDDEHQLLEPIQNGVAGVFVDLLREFAGEGRDLGRLRFALTDEFVVSGRRDALGAIERTLQSIDAGRRFPDAVALLEAIVEHFADAAAQLAQQLTETLDLIEDHVIDDAMRDEPRRLGPVRRTAVRLHRQLASLRVLFRRWSQPGRAEMPSRIGLAADRLAQRLEGLDQEIVALQERARLLQDEIAAKLAAETNRHLFALSLATVFLLPPTLVAGIFGMNVSDLPFTKDPGGFPWAMALCVLSSAAVYGFLRWLRIMR